jgi:uncharacterized protein YjbI with pentapeptide repeats
MAKKSRVLLGGRHRLDELQVIFTPIEKRLLRGQTFCGLELSRIDFSNADLRLAEFLNASLRDCDFSGADLRCASFIACDLRSANFAHATFGWTRFDRSWLIGAHGLSAHMSEYARRQGALLWAS